MQIIRSRHTELHNIHTIAILADAGCREGWKENFPRLLEHVWRRHQPDLFLVAGDLAVHGTDEEFRAILAAMQPYPALLAAVPGDHDRPLRTFARHFGSCRKIVDVGKWRFIGINTSHRRFPKSEADFLEKHLRRNTCILSHLPPAMDGWGFHSLGPRYSELFISLLDRHKSKIRAAFFGHIHGYSRKIRSGVPMIVTGAVAESLAVRNNGYAGPGFFQMMIMNTRTGRLTLCKMP